MKSPLNQPPAAGTLSPPFLLKRPFGGLSVARLLGSIAGKVDELVSTLLSVEVKDILSTPKAQFLSVPKVPCHF